MPSLISSCESWIHMSDKTIKILEDLQLSLYRKLLDVPKSCPSPILLWEFGSKSIKFRIIERKLNFIHHLLNLSPETLANQILTIQINKNIPGLVSECKSYIKHLKLQDIFQNKIPIKQWKLMVKEAVRDANIRELKIKMSLYKKLKHLDLTNDTFGMKSYLKNLNLMNVRILFRYRTKMIKNVKMNFSSDPINIATCWTCQCGQIDTNEHLLSCDLYTIIRQNIIFDSDSNLCDYLWKSTRARAKT